MEKSKRDTRSYLRKEQKEGEKETELENNERRQLVGKRIKGRTKEINAERVI